MIRRSLVLTLSAALVVGVAGPSGAVGTTTRTSSNLFASVEKNGSLINGNGVSGVTHFGPGRYEVTFVVDVSPCAYVATTHHAYSQAIQVFTAGGHLDANGVYVETKNQGGGLTNGPFDLIVVCAAAGMSFAVVGYDGALARATPGTTLTPLGSGRYDVTFPSDVSACAYLASVGDPGNGLVFSPSGVYTGSSSAGTDTVYIETKNPGGGLQDGIPFHLAVVCPSAADVRVAVVKNSGHMHRGSALTSSFRRSTGEYIAVTNRSAGACAKIATRGSVNTAVPFFPATVEIVGGPARNTWGVEVRDLLFFGGGLTNQAFHTAIVC